MERALTGVFAAEKGEVSATPLLYVLLGKLRQLSESREERRLRAVFERAAQAFADTLSRAVDREDLIHRLEGLVQSGHLARIERVARKLPRNQVDQMLEDFAANESLAPRLEERLGHAVSGHLLGGFRLTQACAEAERRGDLEALSQYFPEQDRATRSQQDGGFPLIEDPTIPVAVAASLLEALKGDVALVAVTTCIEQRGRLEPWIALALAETFERGQYERLRFWTLVPGAEVPVGLVPEQDRWNLAELAASQKALNQRARAIAEQVRKTKRPVGRLPTD